MGKRSERLVLHVGPGGLAVAAATVLEGDVERELPEVLGNENIASEDGGIVRVESPGEDADEELLCVLRMENGANVDEETEEVSAARGAAKSELPEDILVGSMRTNPSLLKTK